MTNSGFDPDFFAELKSELCSVNQNENDQTSSVLHQNNLTCPEFSTVLCIKTSF